MAFILKDRVRETSTSTGTGSFTLDGTVSGFQTFDAVLNTSDTTWYCIVNGAEWEVGLGTFTSPATLARTTVISSSSGGSAVNFASGTKDVFMTIPGSTAEALQSLGALGTAAYVNTGTSSGNVPVLDGSGRLASGVIPTSIAPLASPTFTGTPAAPTASAGTNTTQIATTAYVVSEIAARIASLDVMTYKGLIDCSTNPNYPAASAGDTYRVSVAGKIGGGSGPNVEVGDLLLCLTDSTSAGTHASVGANWNIAQANIDGAVTGPASSTSGNVATFSGTSGKIVQDGGKALPSGAIVGTTDSQTLTNKTLTSPAITTPTGIVKGDVGLGNVDNLAVAGKQSIPVPAASMVARTTNGAASFTVELATNDVMLRGYDFDTSTAEAAQFAVTLPKQWNESTITFRYKWTAASGSGGVAFSLRARAASDDDAMDGSWGTAVTVTDTFITANDLHTSSESSAVTIGNSPAEGDMIFFEITREVANGSDTLAVDARLLEVEIFITTDAARDN